MVRPSRRARHSDHASGPLDRRLRLESLEQRLPLATFTVNSLADLPINLTDNVVTLRDAINAANNNVAVSPGGPVGDSLITDRVQFQSGLSGTITLTQGALNPRSRLSINGPGSDVIIVHGGATNTRVFQVDNFSSVTVFVTIRGLRITGGESTAGGGIFNRESLTLENSLVTGNMADRGGGVFNDADAGLTVINSQIDDNQQLAGGFAGGGGGLYNAGQATLVDSRVQGNEAFTKAGIANTGTLTLRNSLVSSNQSERDIGGIFNEGTLTVLDSRITNNHAGPFLDSTERVGGISNGSLATATIRNSSIDQNRAGENGGISNAGVMILENTTVSGNIASRAVAGVFNSGSLTLRNSTIAFNQEIISGVGVLPQAGLANSNVFGVLMHNSIVANNTHREGTGEPVADNYSGEPASPTSTHNLIGPSDSSGLTNGVNGNLIGVVSALLGSLDFNGGPTPNHLPLFGSPAIDAGGAANIPIDSFDDDGDGNTTEPIPFDQRGSGFLRIGGAVVDIGAVEVQSAPAIVGDYNADGTVNAADYTIWRDTLGSTTNLAANGDASNNLIDTADYGVWEANFGETQGRGASQPLALPGDRGTDTPVRSSSRRVLHGGQECPPHADARMLALLDFLDSFSAHDESAKFSLWNVIEESSDDANREAVFTALDLKLGWPLVQ